MAGKEIREDLYTHGSEGEARSHSIPGIDKHEEGKEDKGQIPPDNGCFVIQDHTDSYFGDGWRGI